MTSPNALDREHLLFNQHRVALLTAFAFLALAVILFVAMANDAATSAVQRIDDTVRDGARAIQWGPLTVLAKALNILGSAYVTWPLRGAVAVWLWSRRRWEALWVWIIATAIYEPLLGIIKDLYARPRPPNPAVTVTGFSFPSGHAVVGAAIAIGLVMVIVPAGPKQRYYEILAGGFAFSMAASRVYLDAHWMSDAVAGVALGAAVMLGVGAVVHELNDRMHARATAPP